MEKEHEEVEKEVQAFKAMSSEDRRKKLKEEADRVEGLEKEIISNLKAIQNVEKKLKDAKDSLETTQRKLDEARIKRQNALALEQNTEAFDREIKKLLLDLQEQESLLEDTSIGLTRRIESLKNEVALLKEEKAKAEKMILRFKLVPLAEEWNQTAQKLANLFPEIYELEASLNESPYGWRTLTFSGGLSYLPKLYLIGDVKPEDMYQGRLRHVFSYEHFKESRKNQ